MAFDPVQVWLRIIIPMALDRSVPPVSRATSSRATPPSSAPSAISAPRLSDLPTELIVQILAALPIEDLGRVCCVASDFWRENQGARQNLEPPKFGRPKLVSAETSAEASAVTSAESSAVVSAVVSEPSCGVMLHALRLRASRRGGAGQPPPPPMPPEEQHRCIAWYMWDERRAQRDLEEGLEACCRWVLGGGSASLGAACAC
jgi:hypothetical protein